MGSRSKLMLELVTKNADDLNADNIINNKNTDFIEHANENEIIMNPGPSQSNRRRSRSTSSSSSSSTSSSSGTSSVSSFDEDSDDSVKDPDYQDVREIPKFSFQLEQLSGISTITEPNFEAVSENEEKSAIDSDVLDSNGHTAHGNTINESYTITEDENPNSVIDSAVSVEPVVVNMEVETPTKKGKKRPIQASNWKKNVAKKLRNQGKIYQSAKTNKQMPERKLKPPCKDTCKYKCQYNITESQRQELLNDYWTLGNIERQWSFILQSMEEVKPTHRYVRIDENGIQAPKRGTNNAFFFTLLGKKIRVCKIFYINTLAINNRPIETALKKKNKQTNVTLLKDNRGCHSNHAHVDDTLKNAARDFIKAIPKIESHYIRAKSNKHYIDGSKTISDIHRDYVEHCKNNNMAFVNYVMFYRIFTQDFNISFFIPKKDACEFCEAYKNSSAEEKELKQQIYSQHHEEKLLSRLEKEKDKNDHNIVVAVYDLQAVFQCPKGDISVFYYKSKLNVLNLTIYDLKTNDVESYVWDESQAYRGVNEIATCVFKYLKKISDGDKAVDVVFYSDNCAGQQKNKFMMAMYLYAVQTYVNIKSITHKFLIKGHTQNEGDSVHSQIERQVKRQMRSGPIYTPEGFIGAIKAARKKSTPIHVNEMCHSDIFDWKVACNQMNFMLKKDDDKNIVKLTEIKIFKVQKEEPEVLYYKTSYKDEFKKARVIKQRSNFSFHLKKAFNRKPGLAERKKQDLLSLLNSNHVPGYYRAFYESL